jgi:cation transport regulator ChaB
VKSVAKSFDQLIKGEPSAGDVHVSTALGNQQPRRRRYKPFSAFVSGGPKKPSDGPSTFGPMPVITATTKSFKDILKRAPIAERLRRLEARNPGVLGRVDKKYATVADLPSAVRGKLKGKKARQWMRVFNSVYDAHADLPKKDRESRAFAGAWATVGKQLGTPTAPPFPTDLGFMSRLSGPQVPSFLWALTHRDQLPKAKVPMDSLVAIQDRIDPKDVARDEEEPPTQRPTVVRLHGTNYIADGHDRLSARLLGGKKNANVRLHDIDHPVDPEAVKKLHSWELPYRITKVDPDQYLVFGFASTATKRGKLIVDKQGDAIDPAELEKAAYDFVLTSRNQGDMHARTAGVGRMVESMVFTKEKQNAIQQHLDKMGDGGKIDLKKEAWFIGFKVDCPNLWDDIKKGKKLEFSIGGAAVPIALEV